MNNDIAGCKNRQIGNAIEDFVLNWILGFACVKYARIDINNSSFDILFMLHGEDFFRGIQTKKLSVDSKSKSKSSKPYAARETNGYPNNTLMIMVNMEAQFGITYLMSDEDNRSGNSISVRYPLVNNRTQISKYTRLASSFDKLKPQIETHLKSAIIVTNEVYIKNISPTILKEIYSMGRFKQFCDTYGIPYEDVRDNSAPTDLLVYKKLMQMKFSSIKYGTNGDMIRIKLSRGQNKPYEKGQNNYYVIEVETHIGWFLIIPESILINAGFISEDDSIETRNCLRIFPHNYNSKTKTFDEPTEKFFKNRWSSNPNLWWSIEVGWLGQPGQDNVKEKFFNFLNSPQLFRDIENVSLAEEMNTAWACRQRLSEFCRQRQCSYQFPNKKRCRELMFLDQNSVLLFCKNKLKNGEYRVAFTRTDNDKPITKGTYKYFIIQLSGYYKYFLILPEEVLLYLQVLKTDVNSGKSSTTVCPYGTTNDHWSCKPEITKYWYQLN
jgi:hypothetical protein